MLGHHDVFNDRHAAEKPDILKRARYAETCYPVCRKPRYVGAGEDNRSPGRLDETGKTVEQSRFTGAIRTDDAHDGPAPEREADVFDRPDAAEVLGNPSNIEKRQPFPQKVPADGRS